MNLEKLSSLINGNPTHIATVRPDGKPQLAVASDVKVISNDEILISVNEMNTTPKNLAKNPAVVLTSFNKDWEGVRIFGNGAFYDSGKYFDIAKEEFDEEFYKSSGNHIKGALVIKVDKIQEYK